MLDHESLEDFCDFTQDFKPVFSLISHTSAQPRVPVARNYHHKLSLPANFYLSPFEVFTLDSHSH